jgi:hypothetical protein
MHAVLQHSRFLVVAAVIVMGSVTAAQARLISVDMQSSANTSGAAPQNFTGVEPEAAAVNPAFGAANIWNYPQIPRIPATTNPTFPNLVDSTGAGTTVSLSISGTISAFNIFSIVSGADALRGDAFYWGNVGLPETSVSIDWTLTGLPPNTPHLLFVYTTFWNGSDTFNMLVDTNGDGSLSDETPKLVSSGNRVQPAGVLFNAMSDASGVIHGRGVGTGDQARWAGFQLVEGSVTSCPTTFDFDFSGNQYEKCFRDVHQGGLINAGLDIGPTDHPALVFTGQTGSGGATWLTVYDDTPGTPTPGPTFGAETLCADVLFTRFNNIKGAGVVALLNEGVGKSGLALVVSDAGNTDLLQLATLDGDPTKKGKLKILSSAPLKNGIAENVWYRLVMTVDPTPTAGRPLVTGKVFTHSTPTDPDSPLGVQVGTTLTYEQPLPDGVSHPGQNGILAQAVSAVVDLSVTNFTNDPALCAPLVK